MGEDSQQQSLIGKDARKFAEYGGMAMPVCEKD